MNINVNVVNQKLNIASDLKRFVSGTQRFICFTFKLPADWEDLTCTAQFMQNNVAYDVVLNTSHQAYMPPEIGPGRCTMMLYGSSGNIRATTNFLEFTIDQSLQITGSQTHDLTPTLYDQFCAYVDRKFREIVDLDDEDVQQLISDQVTSLITNYINSDEFVQRTISIPDGSITNAKIADGTISRSKVNSAFEATLAKADTALQSIADGSISREMVNSAFEATLAKADTAMQSIPDASIARSKVNAAFEATLAKADASSATIVVNQLPSSGVAGTDYILADNGLYMYYKYINNAWQLISGGTAEIITQDYNIDYFEHGDPEDNDYVADASYVGKYYLDIATLTPYTVVSETETVDEEEVTTYSWEAGEPYVESPSEFSDYYIQFNGGDILHFRYVSDEFIQVGSSSSTQIVTELPQSGFADVDYILVTNGEYQYYKYLDNDWRLISGGGGEIIVAPSTIDGDVIFLLGDDSPTAVPQDLDEDYVYLYVNTANMDYYSIDSEADPISWVRGGALVETPSQNKDYYILDESGKYAHFRYNGISFIRVGADAYNKIEVDTMINNVTDYASSLQLSITDIASDVSELISAVNNMQNMVSNVTLSLDKKTLTVEYKDGNTSELELDTGLDIDRTAYNIDDDHKLHFYDSQGNELEGLAVEITGGGGGGGGTVSGNVSIARITSPNVQSIFGGDCIIEYNVLAQDSSGEEVAPGTGTLYVNNIAVLSGFTVYNSIEGAYNSINVGEYLSVGTNSIKISVSINTGGEANTVTTKTWSVNAINMYFTWDYIDSKINTSAVTDYYTPYGSLNKTIYTFLDVEPVGFNPKIVTALPDVTSEEFDPEEVVGVNYFVGSGTNYTHYVYDEENEEFVEAPGRIINVNTTTRSGVQQTMSIPMQTHGSHTVVRYMVGDVNGDIIAADPQVHDMIFVVSGDTNPIIGVSYNTAKMVQYNTVQIPIVVYDPSSTTTTVILREDGDIVSTWTGVDRTVHYWNYSPTTFGTKTLTISCGEVSKTIMIEVEELSISEEEISGYDFRFKASEMATNTAVQEWANTYLPNGSSEEKTVSITFSDNFDWVNGGLHTEYDEDDHLRQYLCVRAGTTMTINYDLFGKDYDPKQYGKNFKFIFKAVNCRTYDANVLTCIDTGENNNGVGLVMTANEATLTTANNSVKTYYYKDSYIEFETNIHPTTEYRYLQVWMDGAPEVTKIYDTSDSMQQVTPVGITIGSPNCDVYVYMIKAYPLYLSNDNELSNFIMDAPNAYEMVDRYNRNDVMSDSGEVDYQKLANANPDLHVILLDLNRMSTGKKDNVVAYTARHIYNAGGESQCFTVNNACITIQGTSSVGYLESAGNMDINLKYNRSFTSDNVSYSTSQISFDDGTVSTSGYSMTANSIPVDYINIKVNVASSENANNACNVDWYNTYQPWTSPARAKNPKARDTMEFVPGVVFIRDRSGNLFGDTAGYHMYGICDIGNSKKNTKVFHDTKNPIACCVEVSNNTSLPCLMSSKEYTWNADDEATIMELDPESGELKEQKVYEFRYVDDDSAKMAEDAWDRFVGFMYDYNPNLATDEPLPEPVTFGTYTFKGYGTYDVSNYNSEDYSVVYLYGYGNPADFGYAASDYVTDTTDEATCYYYINYSNNQIYSSDGTDWTSESTLTWTRSQNNVLGGTSIGTYAGTYTTDSFNYRMAYMLEHCEEYMVMDPVVYHFVFVESFLLTDNVAKNTFWSSDDLVHWEPSKNYDSDTSLGNDK